MLNSWNVFKRSVPLYLCDSKNSMYKNTEDIIIAKSGISNYSCNFAIIDNVNPQTQKEVIKRDFDCDGLLFSLEKNKNNIDSWAEGLNFKYFGRVPLMNKKQSPVNVELKNYDIIRVEKVRSKNDLNDFVRVFSEIRNISYEDGSSIISDNFLNRVYFLYVAYYLDEPAGIFTVILTQDGAIVADADVKEKFRNSSVLKVISERAFFDSVNNNIYDYSVIPTSQFAFNVINKYGFTTEGYCDVWKRIGIGEKE